MTTKEFGISTNAIAKAVKRGDSKTRTQSEGMKLSRKLRPEAFKQTEETKKKISESRKRYLRENPDKVPYLLNHSSKESYPEKYFNKIFSNNNLPIKRYHRISLYELDFAILDKKICIEVDGEQHYSDPKIKKSDIKRDKFLKDNNWDIIRIRWAKYQKMNKEEKEDYINSLVDYINDIVDRKPTIIEKEVNEHICKCGSKMVKQAKECRKCHLISRRKVKNRPSYKQLLKDIEETNYTKTGEKYEVSDNCIRKWLKQYENS